MKDIRLDKAETLLFQEVGSRGDAFRRATRDRGLEQARVAGKMVEILGSDGAMVDSIPVSEPVPES
jgi:hypothetical protein